MRWEKRALQRNHFALDRFDRQSSAGRQTFDEAAPSAGCKDKGIGFVLPEWSLRRHNSVWLHLKANDRLVKHQVAAGRDKRASECDAKRPVVHLCLPRRPEHALAIGRQSRLKSARSGWFQKLDLV